jgi:hypothetical protein
MQPTTPAPCLTTPACHRRPYRPHTEVLEDRTLPSTITVLTNADSAWARSSDTRPRRCNLVAGARAGW